MRSRDLEKANATEEILRQCAEARQASRDRVQKQKQEQEQLAIRIHEEMCARWAQAPVPSSFQASQPAQHYAHPSAIGQVQPTHALGGIYQPPQSLYTVPPHLDFNQFAPPPWTNVPPSGLIAPPQAAPNFAPAPGFGNLPPSGFGANESAQHGFHQVLHPGFPPVPQQVTDPGHEQELAKQAPESRMQNPLSGPDEVHVPFAHIADFTIAPIDSGNTAIANSTTHNPSGQFHADATHESLSGTLGKHTSCNLAFSQLPLPNSLV